MQLLELNLHLLKLDISGHDPEIPHRDPVSHSRVFAKDDRVSTSWTFADFSSDTLACLTGAFSRRGNQVNVHWRTGHCQLPYGKLISTLIGSNRHARCAIFPCGDDLTGALRGNATT